MKKKLQHKIWDWFTQFSVACAIGTLVMVTASLMMNGIGNDFLFYEYIPYIRNFEVGSGIFSIIVLSINLLHKFDRMAKKQ